MGTFESMDLAHQHMQNVEASKEKRIKELYRAAELHRIMIIELAKLLLDGEKLEQWRQNVNRKLNEMKK
jgi:hypothetical protein